MENKLSSLKVIKKIIDLSREFKSGSVDSKLYESVKASTLNLRKNNPEFDLEYFLNTLYTSTMLSATKMLSEDTFDDSVNMILDIGKEYARMIGVEEDDLSEELENDIVKFFLKMEIITGMLNNSVDLSVKAIQDSFGEVN